MKRQGIDKIFAFVVFLLAFCGLVIFISASLSLLSRSGANFYGIAFNHIIFGLCGGLVGAFILSFIPYQLLKKYSLPFFIFSFLLTLMVFVPGIGVKSNGSHRWINILGQTFQPSEVLKIATILYMASIFTNLKDKIKDWKYGLGYFIGISSLIAIIFALQPDTATFGVLCIPLLAMFFTAGGKIRHIAVIGFFGLLVFVGLVFTKPYLKARVMTFINPAENSLGSGYQIQQSLIAIGSGGLTGRGFGQSLQKFNFLPEAISDSIFAVFSEEFGFLGSVAIIILFVIFAVRGLKIASNVPDMFGRLTVVGIVILLTTQAFVNIASMIGIIPLTGEPLPFISQGGTALLFEFIAVGIVFNISKYQKT
ncbi:MAG: putative peptidoglycan glycosyltransferase FtsW [bacterium]